MVASRFASEKLRPRFARCNRKSSTAVSEIYHTLHASATGAQQASAAARPVPSGWPPQRHPSCLGAGGTGGASAGSAVSMTTAVAAGMLNMPGCLFARVTVRVTKLVFCFE